MGLCTCTEPGTGEVLQEQSRSWKEALVHCASQSSHCPADRPRPPSQVGTALQYPLVSHQGLKLHMQISVLLLSTHTRLLV